MKNGKLVATLGAVALVAAVGIGSTLAYLSDQAGPVTNKFTIGHVSFDENLAGGLAEKQVTADNNGNYVFVDADKTNDKNWVTENTYSKVTPGETLVKNPTAFIDSDSEPAWLFVRVSRSEDFEDITFNQAFEVLNKDTYEKDGYWDLKLTNKTVAGNRYEIFASVKVADIASDADEDVSLDNITINAALVQAEGIDADKAYTEAKDLLDKASTPAPAAPAED